MSLGVQSSSRTTRQKALSGPRPPRDPTRGRYHAAGVRVTRPIPPHPIGLAMKCMTKLRERGVEGGVGERQLFGGGLADVYAGQPFAAAANDADGSTALTPGRPGSPARPSARRAAPRVEDPLAGADPG